MANVVRFRGLDENSSYDQFNEVLDQFISLDSFQGIHHFYAIMDQNKEIGKILKENKLPYFRDSDLSTPLENAYLFQSLDTVYEILKECPDSNQFFLSFEDTKTLINF